MGGGDHMRTPHSSARKLLCVALAEEVADQTVVRHVPHVRRAVVADAAGICDDVLRKRRHAV
jgi:hypothetical protein